MTVPKNLPNTILDLAFKSGSELAWKKDDIPLVLAELVRLHLAAWGGEIWTVYPNGRISQDVPNKEGGWPGVYTWEVSRNEGEPWLEFVQRAALYTEERIRIMAAEEWTRPDIAPLLRYNLDIDDEDMYNEFRSRHPRRAAQG